MLGLLELLADLLGVADFVCGAIRFWRISVSCFIAGSMVAVLCFWFESPAIRWIGGFHLVIAAITAGVIWETRRGRLRPDRSWTR
jgi:hypothetical protein